MVPVFDPRDSGTRAGGRPCGRDKQPWTATFSEFLGSLDNDDVAWAAYLSSVDTPESNAPKPAKPAEKSAPEGESK